MIDVPTIGRMQMMKDPQGAAFYIYSRRRAEERPEAAPEVGEASWHELMTTDASAAMNFYSEIFGWQPSRRWTWVRWASTTCSIGRTA